MPRTANSKVNIPVGYMFNQPYNQNKNSISNTRPMTYDIQSNIDNNEYQDNNEIVNNNYEDDRPIKAAENPDSL